MNYWSQQVEEIFDWREFLAFARRKWKMMLASMLIGMVVLLVLGVIAEIVQNNLSAGMTVLYAVSGLLAGLIVFVFLAFYLYRSEGKLRDAQTFFNWYHVFILGAPNHPAGKKDAADPDAEWARIAGEIRAITREDGRRLLVTGTGADGVVQEAYQKLAACLGDGSDRLWMSENPLGCVETMEQLSQCQVILVEKQHASRIAEMDQLLTFLAHCNVPVIGVVVF